MQKSLIPRKFRIGQIVQTESGTVAKVIGSAIYGVVDGKPTRFAWVEYRLKPREHKRKLLLIPSMRTFYRRESELTKYMEK